MFAEIVVNDALVGSVAETKFVQDANTLVPKVVTEFGIVIEVNDVQPLNALFPIPVTELGIVIEANDMQF
jgi:hypothetical protein